MINANHNKKRMICIMIVTFVLCSIDVQSIALPTDPSNAALLYYQAFMLRPEPNFLLIDNVLRGANPNEDVRKYLNLPRCQKTIGLARIATQLPTCNWGLLYSRGYGLSTQTIVQLRRLCNLLEVYSRTLAADGEYREALSMCIGIRRLAAHIGEDTILMFSESQAANRRSLTCIQHILESMPSDFETLMWLKDQLESVQGTTWKPAQTLNEWRDMELQYLRSRPKGRPFIRNLFLEQIKDESEKKELMTLTDEKLLVMFLREERIFPGKYNISVPPKLLARAQQEFDKLLESALKIIESDMTYGEKQKDLLKLTGPHELEYQANSGNPIILLENCIRIEPYYKLMVGNVAHFNGLMSAIEIYLVKAKTGQLPEKLPDGLPKDPYSGENFKYKKTKEGFLLQCKGEDFYQRWKGRLKFKVKK
jgi:hypothetical protein